MAKGSCRARRLSARYWRSPWAWLRARQCRRAAPFRYRDTGQDDDRAGEEIPRDRLSEDGGAERDGDDWQQVGDGGGGGGAFVLDEAVVEHVGDAGAERAEREHAQDDVGLEVDRLARDKEAR